VFIFRAGATMNEMKNMSNPRSAGSFMADAISRRLKERLDVAPLIVAVSGIDASGKSTLARRAAAELNARGVGAVVISGDDWHNPPEKRFSASNPAEHFYQNAFRFDELFRILIQPLRRLRELQVTIGLTRLPQNESFRKTYDFRGVDVVILEGIFLLKREFMGNYDLSFWVDCSFQTALARALQRNQEGLSGGEIVRDYQTIYFAAQKIHFAKDAPRENADFVIANGAATSPGSVRQRAARVVELDAARRTTLVPARLASLGLRAKELEQFDAWRFASTESGLECT